MALNISIKRISQKQQPFEMISMTEIQNEITFTRSDLGSLTHSVDVLLVVSIEGKYTVVFVLFCLFGITQTCKATRKCKCTLFSNVFDCERETSSAF